MPIMNFTVEETNIISMYRTNTLAATLAAIDQAMPFIYDEDILEMVEDAGGKLSTLTEQDFSTLIFPPTDETEPEPSEE